MVELLSPARDADVAICAIDHGADAVYIGAPSHGARAAAANTLDDIRRVVDYAHPFGVKVYVTLNTIIYDHELDDVALLIRQLYRIGVDALIVQDMALLQLSIPPIALHASTQCDTRTPEKARFLARSGFSQIVVARELSTREISAITSAVDCPVEVFVHGALCVSYSGDCRAGYLTAGRSGNRGECPQVCRYSFDLVDGAGTTLIKDKHLLSLRDMNRLPALASIIDAGARSLKIEGRLKDERYVKNVTAHYHTALCQLGVERPSWGRVELRFTPDAKRSFNRGFTPYFIGGAPRMAAAVTPDPRWLKMASIDTPKATGQPVATVTGSAGKAILVKATAELHNGDGLGYFDAQRRFKGFRLNRVEGNKIYPAGDVRPAPGTRLYRNADKAFDDLLAAPTATRTIDVAFTLRRVGASRLALDAVDSRGASVTATATLAEPIAPSQKPQLEPRRRTLSKTLDTIYRVSTIDDRCGDSFIPLSALADLRRRTLELLSRAATITYRYDYRPLPTATPEPLPESMRRLTFHDNVANRLARQFYTERGARSIEPAVEVAVPQADTAVGEIEVMRTRYCLRREMGCCLKHPEGRRWREPLSLVSASVRFGLHFDCRRCEMTVTLPAVKAGDSKPDSKAATNTASAHR